MTKNISRSFERPIVGDAVWEENTQKKWQGLQVTCLGRPLSTSRIKEWELCLGNPKHWILYMACMMRKRRVSQGKGDIMGQELLFA